MIQFKDELLARPHKGRLIAHRIIIIDEGASPFFALAPHLQNVFQRLRVHDGMIGQQGGSEINQFNVAFIRQHDVLGFEVPVHHPFRM